MCVREYENSSCAQGREAIKGGDAAVFVVGHHAQQRQADDGDEHRPAGRGEDEDKACALQSSLCVRRTRLEVAIVGPSLRFVALDVDAGEPAQLSGPAAPDAHELGNGQKGH